ncbi:MAG TPA: S8 family serine peptidase, partial [Actinomycetota bacterium]|nr:S8 family serine peptidase [Actinomycetota bacterium]
MNKSSLSAVLVVVLAALAAAAPVGASASGGDTATRRALVDARILDNPEYQSVLVHVRRASTMSEGVAALRSAGALIGTRYRAIKVFVAYGDRATLLRAARSRHVHALEANGPLELYTETSHVATRGQDVLDGALTARRGTRIDGRGVGVAVVDSGVDGTHPDLESRMALNVKIVCSTPQFVVTSVTGGFTQCLGPKTVVGLDDTDTPSAGGHGTHVAGIVAGAGSASDGRYHGAAPKAKLYGVSVGTVITVENALDGLQWVLDNHDMVRPRIRVVNNSWGSAYSPYDPENGPFHKALWKLQELLVDRGVTVVFAAGNAGGDGGEPTTTAECINPTPGVVCVADYD